MVVPDGLEWRELVQDHPLASMGVVAAVGFIVGRFHGDRIVDIARSAATDRVDQSIGKYKKFVGEK